MVTSGDTCSARRTWIYHSLTRAKQTTTNARATLHAAAGACPACRAVHQPMPMLIARTPPPPLAAAAAAAPADWQKTFFEIVSGHAPDVWERVIASIALIAVVFIPSVLLLAMFSIWWERKVCAHMQSRPG